MTLRSHDLLKLADGTWPSSEYFFRCAACQQPFEAHGPDKHCLFGPGVLSTPTDIIYVDGVPHRVTQVDYADQSFTIAEIKGSADG